MYAILSSKVPKVFTFSFFIDDKSVGVALANCKTSLFVLCSVHGIFSILLSFNISKACSFFVVIFVNVCLLEDNNCL